MWGLHRKCLDASACRPLESIESPKVAPLCGRHETSGKNTMDHADCLNLPFVHWHYETRNRLRNTWSPRWHGNRKYRTPLILCVLGSNAVRADRPCQTSACQHEVARVQTAEKSKDATAIISPEFKQLRNLKIQHVRYSNGWYFAIRIWIFRKACKKV